MTKKKSDVSEFADVDKELDEAVAEMSRPNPEAEHMKANASKIGDSSRTYVGEGAFIDGEWVPRTHAPRTPPAKRVARAERIKKVLDQREYTGGATSYYEIDILYPHKPKRKPYMAECLDIIEALGMSFAEGECFKAIWRKCAARQGKSKRGYDDAKYDAEKVAFYASRILDDVVTPKGKKE